jgi:ATPase subunit of ABC transporter with duplicated ATPase domains
VARLQNLVDRFGAKASKASMAHSLEKRIVRIEADRVEGPKGDRAIQVKFPAPPHSGRVTLEVERLSKSYGGPAVFADISFDVPRGERLLILGLNGAGKTSLLRILAGETVADAGSFRFGHQVSAGYYAQEHDGLVADRSLLDHLREQAGLPDTTLRALLGMFGLTGEKAHQPAGTLSGGEKTKLALAQLVAGRHNLLLLDEPTNNLDPPSREAVADALAGWPGSMVVVSHDAEFVERLAPQRVLLMPDGDVDYWHDDLADLVALA